MSKRIEIVYVGRRPATKGIGYFYLNIETDRQMGFVKKLGGMGTVGTVLEVDETDTGVGGPYTFKRVHDDKDLIEKWVNLDKATSLQIETEKLMKKEPDTRYEKAIETLRTNYQQLSSAQRLAFLVRIQRDVTKY